ncbi:MAG: serine/threonine protein phosphatase [Saprospiraceae bacterium]|nr:serine/threonine protein phosphatase [Saprospiraceae bacterium]
MPTARTLILTDIHGCNATLKKLLEKLDPQAEDHFCFLGDYIDRGPDSKGVIDTIWALEKQVKKVTCLMGNHEELLLEGHRGNATFLDIWLRNGGRQTLQSFDAKSVFDIPDKYLRFFADTRQWAEVDGAILVHAGLNFQQDSHNPFADPESMRWIRLWYQSINYDWLGDRIIIHGHTPTPLEKIQDMKENLEQNRYLNLDSGCVYDRPGEGYLTAFDLTNKELVSVKRV